MTRPQRSLVLLETAISTQDNGVVLSIHHKAVDSGMMTAPRTTEWGHMEYCTCKSPPGYSSLRDEPLNTFVCGSCRKPSYLVWLGSEIFCEECGGSIYTRWEKVCSSCQTTLLEWATDLRREAVPPQDWPPILSDVKSRAWIGWPKAAELSENAYPYWWSAA